MKDRPEVFFSYAREDEARVAEVYRLLESKGFHPWMDTRDIAGGEDWGLAIKRAIRRANFFLVFVSHFSIVKTGVLKDEMEAGISIRQENLEQERFLIPVRLEEVDLPESLKPYQWVDYFRNDGRARLLRAVGYKPPPLLLYVAAAVLLAMLGYISWDVYERSGDPIRAFAAQRQRPANNSADRNKAWLGITIWEMRPSLATDPPAFREIIHPEDAPAKKEEELTPVRSKTKLILPREAKFRIGIESSRSGYLYIVDRAEYGTELTAPVLVFPTTRIRRGDNQISNGSYVEIPSDYWQLQARRSGYHGEQVTILLTPAPLPLSIGRDQLQLDATEFDKWEHAWGVRSRLVSSLPGDGAMVTRQELESRNNPNRNLTPQDPSPLSLFELTTQPNVPVLFHFSISVAELQ